MESNFKKYLRGEIELDDDIIWEYIYKNKLYEISNESLKMELGEILFEKYSNDLYDFEFELRKNE